MKVPFLDLKAQYQTIKDEVRPVVEAAMESGAFIGGPNVIEFEKEFAGYCGVTHCIGVGSGTDALRFAMMALGVGPGDEVITVPNTFIATTESISQVGATPVFVDVDPETCLIDVNKIEAAITEKTKAVIPVHLYGMTADMDPIADLAKRHDLFVVEDACQSHGATYKGGVAGSIGDAGCFSFYPGKNLGAFGEAGAVTTNDQSVADKIRMIRDHGQREKYIHDIEGYNGRLDAIQAGILRVKLKHLSAWSNRRREIARSYKELLGAIDGIVFQKIPVDCASVFHLFEIFVEDRSGLQAFLGEHEIGTGLHYPVPLHLQDAYKHLGYKKGDFPAAEKRADQLLSLPMFPEMTDQQIEYVAEKVKHFFNGKIA